MFGDASHWTVKLPVHQNSEAHFVGVQLFSLVVHRKIRSPQKTDREEAGTSARSGTEEQVRKGTECKARKGTGSPAFGAGLEGGRDGFLGLFWG